MAVATFLFLPHLTCIQDNLDSFLSFIILIKKGTQTSNSLFSFWQLVTSLTEPLTFSCPVKEAAGLGEKKAKQDNCIGVANGD